MPTAELTEDGLGITITAAYADSHLIQALPGVGWRDEAKVWYVRATWPACLILRQLFGHRLILGPRLQEWGEAQRQQVLAREQLRMWLQAPDGSPIRELFRGIHVNKLFEFQYIGAAWGAMEGASLFADEMGSGKTAQAVTAARLVDTIGIGALPMLVICPGSMRETWRREISMWWPDVKVAVIQGNAGERRKLIAAGADVMIMSWNVLQSHTRLAGYSGVRMKKCPECGGETDPATGLGLVTITACETHERELNKLAVPFKTVIADEAHRAKDPHAKWTRAWWWLAWHAQIRYALTGTPVESSVGDLWSILHGLDPVSFPGKTKFLDLFATMSRNFFGGNEILGLKPENRKLFYDILNLYMRRLPKEITLPFLPAMMPPVYRFPEMTGPQKKAYQQMAKDMIAWLDAGQLLVASTKLARLTNLISLSSAYGTMVGRVCRECKGQGVFPEGQTFRACGVCQGEGSVQVLQLAEPSCKIDDLLDFVKDHGTKPLVVWAVRRQLIELAAARMAKEKLTFGLFTGAQDDQQKQATVDNFQAGKIQFFLGTIAAGSLGISLTRSDTAFYMQRHPSLIYNQQSENRIHRIGSEGHDAISTVISLTAGSAELRWEEAYGQKEARFEEVVQDEDRLRWLVKGD